MIDEPKHPIVPETPPMVAECAARLAVLQEMEHIITADPLEPIALQYSVYGWSLLRPRNHTCIVSGTTMQELLDALSHLRNQN